MVDLALISDMNLKVFYYALRRAFTQFLLSIPDCSFRYFFNFSVINFWADGFLKKIQKISRKVFFGNLNGYMLI